MLNNAQMQFLEEKEALKSTLKESEILLAA